MGFWNYQHLCKLYKVLGLYTQFGVIGEVAQFHFDMGRMHTIIFHRLTLMSCFLTICNAHLRYHRMLFLFQLSSSFITLASHRELNIQSGFICITQSSQGTFTEKERSHYSKWTLYPEFKTATEWWVNYMMSFEFSPLFHRWFHECTNSVAHSPCEPQSSASFEIGKILVTKMCVFDLTYLCETAVSSCFCNECIWRDRLDSLTSPTLQGHSQSLLDEQDMLLRIHTKPNHC